MAKVSLIIASHLNDIQEIIAGNDNSFINHKINFVKYLVMKYKDTSVEINPNEVYTEFLEKFPTL
jgi:hypothetical protein